MTSSSGASERLMSSDVEEQETGKWHYLVVDPAGIRPRDSAVYSGDRKSSELDRLKEGSIVEVDCRRRSGWTRWLCLSSGGGWVFDVSPKDRKVRLVEVEVLAGDWMYQACCERAVLLPRPSLQLSAKPGKGLKVLEADEVIAVSERVRPLNGKGSFLKLADGRGFVLDFARGRQALRRWQPEGQCSGLTPGGADEGLGAWEPLPPAPCLAAATDISAEPGDGEHGTWSYIVLDPSGICLRGAATYSKSAKIAARLSEGEVVKVVERRRGGGTTFLRLESPAGWAFDLQPCGLIGRSQRMTEVTVDYGTWFYRVCAPKGIALRSRCSFADDSKVGQGPNQGAMLAVTKRVRVGDTTFLKVRDESGWVFDLRDGRRLLEGPVDVREEDGASATVCAAHGVHLLSAPTHNRWAQTNRLLLQGARVQIVRSCSAEGEAWSFVSQPRGMEGWSLAFNFEVGNKLAQTLTSTSGSFDGELVRRALNAPSPMAG